MRGLWYGSVLLLTGCAAVTTYEERSATAYNAYAWGATREAAQAYAEAAKEADRNEQLLWELEAGKAYQAAGDFEASRKWFEQAEASLRGFEDEASLVARDAANEAAAVALNPNTLAYKGLYTDRIFLNVYQGLNYLALGDFEGAAVETRRALLRQQEAREVYASEIERLGEKDGWSEDEAYAGDLGRDYAEVEAAITPEAARLTNPLAGWLRAVVFHMRGDLEQARFNVKELLDEGVRLPDLETYYKALVERLEGGGALGPWCFIIFENGRGPDLKEERLQLLLPKLGYTAVALPKPRMRERPFLSVELQQGDETPINLPVLVTADGLFGAEFKALFPGILVRTLANYVTKEVASRGLVNSADNEDQKVLAYVGTGLYKFFTARGDTRVWRTRGNAFHVAAFPLEGTGAVTLQPIRADGGPVEAVTVVPEKGKHLFLYVQGLFPDKLIAAHAAF